MVSGIKLLFLDMDGVLNHHGSAHYFWITRHNRKTFLEGFEELCPISCSNLNYVLEEIPELRIVISSTWRLFHELSEWDEKMKELCPAIVGRIIGKTPNLINPDQSRVSRGQEIYHWLEQNDHLETPYVVIDDDSDMDGVKDNFILIDNWNGFTWTDAKKVKDHFLTFPTHRKGE